MTITEFDAKLSEVLDADCRLLSAQSSPPSSTEVGQLSAELGVPLPDDFLAFQAKYGATYLEIVEDVWPRPRHYQAGPYYTFLYACVVFGIGREVPDWLDIRHAAAEFRDSLGRDLDQRFVPVFRWVGSADRVCVDDRGQLFEVSHDLAHPKRIEATFLDYVLTQYATLVRNKSTLRRDAPAMFMSDEDKLHQRRAAAMKDATLTSRRCPQCDCPCPSYRRTCKVCGHAIGREE